MQITVANRGPEAAAIRVLPTIWFRNTWAWGGRSRRGRFEARPPSRAARPSRAETMRYGRRWLYAEGEPALLFTENETNAMRLFGDRRSALRQGRHRRGGRARTRRRREPGAHRHQGRRRLRARRSPPAAASASACASRRAAPRTSPTASPFAAFDDTMTARQREADEFYATVIPPDLSRRRPRRDAPEPGRPAVVEAVLPLRREDVARGRPGAAGAAARSAGTGATRSGATCSTPTSSRCRTSGSTRGTPRGTWRSTACRSPSSTPSSPRTSSC